MTETSENIELAADIVAAFVSNNSVVATELPTLIHSVYRALTEAATGAKPKEAAAPLTPAVPIKKSVTAEYIISLEDGRKYKSLKRHLSTRGMTPDDYQVGPPARLSHGRRQLLRSAFPVGQEPGPRASRPRACSRHGARRRTHRRRR
jgi:hypothetical protein